MRRLQSVVRSFPRYGSEPSPVYRPLLLQCGPEHGVSGWTIIRYLRTFFVCWPDHCDLSWTVLFWSTFSVIFYLADMGADLSVALEYFDSKDYVWFSLLFGFIFLPMIISLLYNVCLKGRIWYEAYPVGIFYWSYLTIRAFLNVPRSNTISNVEDATQYIIALGIFQECNRKRTRVGDIDVYFGAMPQLILQSYIAAAVAIETGVDALGWNTWISLALSSLSLLRYEPMARESKKGIIIDVETVLEPAVYDYLADNLSDLMSIVPRAMAIGCFFTVKPTSASASGFLSLHLIVTFLWFWLSAPKNIPGYRSSNRDFRGQRRDRHDYMDHLQAAFATLVFPPTHRAWPENFLSWKDRFRAVATKQFCTVTVFQMAETLGLLALWTWLTEVHMDVVPTIYAVIAWSFARIVCHVLYYACVLFPLYSSEWEGCERRRGLMAKMEIVRMAEELGGYFCPKLRPRLERVRDLCASPTGRSQLREECRWLMDNLVGEFVGKETPTIQRSRTQKHRLKAMVSADRQLLRSAQREAGRCLMLVDSGMGITEAETLTWERLVEECHRLTEEWSKILLACLTHHKLPASFIQAERDLGLAQYPEMFQKLVMKNDLLARRRESREANSKSPVAQRANRVQIYAVPEIIPQLARPPSLEPEPDPTNHTEPTEDFDDGDIEDLREQTEDFVEHTEEEVDEHIEDFGDHTEDFDEVSEDFGEHFDAASFI